MVFDMPTAILDNTFNITTPFIDFFPFSDYCLLQFFHSVEFLSVINSLLKSTPDSVMDRIEIGAVWGPHIIRFVEIDLLQLLRCVTDRVRKHAVLLKRPFATTTFCFESISRNRPFPRTTS